MPKSMPTHFSTGTSVRQPKTTHTNSDSRAIHSPSVYQRQTYHVQKGPQPSRCPHIFLWGQKFGKGPRTSRDSLSRCGHTHPSTIRAVIPSPQHAFQFVFHSITTRKTKHVWEGKAQLLRASLSTTPTDPPPRET